MADDIIQAYELGRERRRTQEEDAYVNKRRPIVDAQKDRAADQSIQRGDQLIRQGDQEIAAGEREAQNALFQRASMFNEVIAQQIEKNPGVKPSDIARTAPPEILRAVGLDKPEAQQMFAQTYDADPSLLRAHARMQGGAGAEVTKQEFATGPDGQEGLLLTFKDGTTRFEPGYRGNKPDTSPGFHVIGDTAYDDKGNRIVQDTAAVQRASAARGEGQVVGKAVGSNVAEDLPWSAADARKAAQVLGNKAAREKNLNAAIDKALGQISDFSAGVGAASKVVPGTPAANLAATLNTVGSIVGLDELQRLRDNSKTGGALGQVTEAEHRLLQSVIASFAQEQSPAELRKGLAYLKQAAKESWQRVEQAYQADIAAQGPPGAAQAASQPATTIARRRYNPATGRLE